jgi:DNA-directed RNA polymerase alpha subunit
VTNENANGPEDFTESGKELYYKGHRAALEAAIGLLKDLLAEIPPPPKGQSTSVESEQPAAFQGRPIDDLGLDVHASNIMRREDVWTIDKLLTLDEDQLLRMKGIGVGTLNHIVVRLRANGLSLGKSIDEVISDVREANEE